MALIGVTVDFDSSKYFVRENYVRALIKYGATVVMLPYDTNCIDSYVKILDGILITGGGFDIHPSNYRCDYVHKEIKKVLENRTSFELELLRNMFSLKKPILGICGGMQLINVAFEGMLIQHLGDITDINHSQVFEARYPSHEINTYGYLQKISKIKKTMVNSSHHQAVEKLGKGLFVNAISIDGIIEGIETDIENSSFCMGVQWHPEYFSSEVDHFIFESFVRKCLNKD